MKANLEYSDDGPEQSVKVLAVRDGVSVLHLETEFTAKQMHAQYTVEIRKCSHHYFF